MAVKEVTIKVKLPSWLVEEARKRGVSEKALATAALKLALLEEILSTHGLDEEDLEWILSRRRKDKGSNYRH